MDIDMEREREWEREREDDTHGKRAHRLGTLLENVVRGKNAQALREAHAAATEVDAAAAPGDPAEDRGYAERCLNPLHHIRPSYTPLEHLPYTIPSKPIKVFCLAGVPAGAGIPALSIKGQHQHGVSRIPKPRSLGAGV